MADQLERAREAVRQASAAAADREAREQLRSIDEGLMEMTRTEDEGAKTESGDLHSDRLEAVEQRLVRLMDETEGAARTHIKDARDSIDAYRQEHTRDW